MSTRTNDLSTYWARPLCQSRVTVHQWDNRRLISDAPALAKLDNSRLLCAVQLWSRDDTAAQLFGDHPCFIFASDDQGASWHEMARLPFLTGKFLCRGSQVWFMGAGADWEGFWVTSSDDGGSTWGQASQIFAGQTYAASTGWVLDDEVLYWAMDDRDPSGPERKVFAVAVNPSGDLRDPGAWRRSNAVAPPGLPAVVGRDLHERAKWLEPNAVRSAGRLLLLVRVVASDGTYGLTPNVAGICDLSDDGDRLDLAFDHYGALPGAQNHFHIAYDPVARLHWMTCNQVTGVASECWRGCGDERRFLMLHYSADALNWFCAGCVAMGASHRHAYNYCTPLIDGDDLLIVSRTAEEADNKHDNDRVTFHRVSDFRSLAMNLWPT